MMARKKNQPQKFSVFGFETRSFRELLTLSVVGVVVVVIVVVVIVAVVVVVAVAVVVVVVVAVAVVVVVGATFISFVRYLFLKLKLSEAKRTKNFLHHHL